MVMCFAPTCKHYSEKHECKFFRFPKNQDEFKKWLQLVRRKDRVPSIHTRICSCHFVDGKAENRPTLYDYNVDKRFQHPESGAKRRRKMVYFEKNSNTEELVPQELFTRQYVKKEQSEINYIHTNIGAAAFSNFNEVKPEVTGFVNDELEIDYHVTEEQSNEVDPLLNFNEGKPEEMGFSSFKQEINRTYLFDKDEVEKKIYLPNIDSVKIEIETHTENEIENNKEFGKIYLHEEIQIKDEDEDVQATASKSFNANASTQTIPHPGSPPNRRLRRKVKILEQSLKRREKTIRSMKDLIAHLKKRGQGSNSLEDKQ